MAKSIIKIIRYLIILSVHLAFTHQSLAQYAERDFFGAKFEPEAKILHGAGQSKEIALAGYLEAVGPKRHPIIYMEYIGAKETLPEIKVEMGRYEHIMGFYPNDMFLQLGLSMTSSGKGYTEKVASGEYDEGLTEIAYYLNGLDRDIFLRIGYEANGFWNGYEPSSYVQAFQHVTNLMRSLSDRIAIVWCVHPINNLNKIMNYYPGDNYVDWWAIDLFEPHFLSNTNTMGFLDSARVHGKPVMIGESTPAKSGVGNGIESWNNWFAPYFQLIQENPQIKAFCYINNNWVYSSLPDWKNARIQDDPYVAEKYRKTLNNEIFVHAQADTSLKTTLVTCTEDGYVVNSSLEHFTTEPEMKVYTNNHDSAISYFMFDLIDMYFHHIERAQIWLAGANDQTEDLKVQVYSCDTLWSESNLTWLEKPEIFDSIGAIITNDGRAKTDYLDISKMVIDDYNKGQRRFSFAIIQPQAEEGVYSFQTRELHTGYSPTLQVISEVEKTWKFKLFIHNYGAPLKDVSVSVFGMEKMTDVDGLVEFNIPLNTGIISYTVRMEGYETYTGSASSQNDNKLVSISLEEFSAVSSKEKINPHQCVDIFPNPSKTTLNIYRLNRTISYLKIYTVSGETAFSSILSEKKEHINIECLPKGLYILEISNFENDQLFKTKILKL